MQCLKTIYDATTENMEVIVVDNNSADDSEALITKSFPQVIWLQMGYNSGFARANNEGIKKSSGVIVLLLNSDTLNEDDTIYKCFARLETDQYIACGVQLLNEDRSPQISGNYFMKGGLNYLMALPYVGRLLHWVALSSGVKKTNIPEAVTTVEVDWINGAFLMVKKDAIEKAGLMDEDFFLYAEEIEWCHRLNYFGKSCIYGDLKLVHLEGGSSGKTFNSNTKGYQVLSDRKGFQIMLSNFLRFRKQYGVAWYLFHLLANIFIIPVFFIAVLLKTIFLQPVKSEWKEWRGYSKNVLASLHYFFKIVSGRPYFYKVL